MPTQTAHITELAEWVETLLTNHKPDLGLEDVWYGEQNLNPRTPSCSVEPEDVERHYEGAYFRSHNTFTINIIVIHGKVQDAQLNRKECDLRGEAIMDLLHKQENVQADGLVIHGHVIRLESGTMSRGNVLYKATRLVWQAVNKTQVVTV